MKLLHPQRRLASPTPWPPTASSSKFLPTASTPNSARPDAPDFFQGVLASLMALTGTFEELTNLFIFAGWIFYGPRRSRALSACAAPSPIYPAPTLLGLPLGPRHLRSRALALTVKPSGSTASPLLIGLLLILAGLPFYPPLAKKKT